MRLAEAGDAVEALAFEIEDFDGFVILGSEENTLAFEIKREMVKVARETWQRRGGD